MSTRSAEATGSLVSAARILSVRLHDAAFFSESLRDCLADLDAALAEYDRAWDEDTREIRARMERTEEHHG